MNADTLSLFGLSAEPFTKEIDDADLWLPPSKQALLDELLERRRGTQECLAGGRARRRKDVRAASPSAWLCLKEHYRLTYCHNVTLGRRDFYRQLCLCSGPGHVEVTAGDVFWAVSTHVELARPGTPPCPSSWSTKRISCTRTRSTTCTSCSTTPGTAAPSCRSSCGLADLEERLRLRRNRSLYSRLHHRLSIGPLTPEDTADYVRMRVVRVGGSKELYSPDAVALLHEAAGGGLRDVDRIATLALRLAGRRKRKVVERDLVARVLQTEGERS